MASNLAIAFGEGRISSFIGYVSKAHEACKRKDFVKCLVINVLTFM